MTRMSFELLKTDEAWIDGFRQMQSIGRAFTPAFCEVFRVNIIRQREWHTTCRAE